MIREDTPLSESASAAVAGVISIRGLHDLRPLLLHSMSDCLRLGESEAASEGVVLHRLGPGAECVAWVGACEHPVFLRQSALIVEAWARKGLRARLVAEPKRHHFNIIDGLADPDLARSFAGQEPS